MPTPDFQAPISVNASTLQPTAAAALRYLVATLGTFAVARGWVDADNIEGIVTIVVTLATVAYGLYRTRSKQAQLITTAEAAPNRVATVE